MGPWHPCGSAVTFLKLRHITSVVWAPVSCVKSPSQFWNFEILCWDSKRRSYWTSSLWEGKCVIQPYESLLSPNLIISSRALYCNNERNQRGSVTGNWSPPASHVSWQMESEDASFETARAAFHWGWLGFKERGCGFLFWHCYVSFSLKN